MTIITEHHKIPGKFYPSFKSIDEAKQISKTATGVPSVDFNVWNLEKTPGKNYIELGDIRLFRKTGNKTVGYLQEFFWFTCAHENHEVEHSPSCAISGYTTTLEAREFAKKLNLVMSNDVKELIAQVNAGNLVVLRDDNGKPIQNRWNYQTTEISEAQLYHGSRAWGSKLILVKNNPVDIKAMRLYLNEIDNTKSNLRFSLKVLQAEAMNVSVDEVAAAKRKLNSARRSINRTNAIEKHYDTLRHTKEHLDEFMDKFVDQDKPYKYEDIKKVISQFERAKVALKAVGSAGKL